ncbi:hypothetical protein BJ875DRAFT_499490 [Amylocarpus encephaloides]|uniref:Uncharacterized protein n=1 Tax=Amylocarpus encephaloides TaxID=45428 RepID=A0A9P7YB32_9HELO|nr:hypothetical protein BJ875DRAFT_499490 [Amylocarpus encephaloides]
MYQPDSGTLTVDLRRLELSFSVNKRNLFASKQLQSEIDPDQSAGTWFGLLSMIVLREITSGWDSIPLKQRSIIIPLGTMSYKKRGIHVGITIENSGDYARYAINEVLGRLDCPAEPRLLYLKAQYHAFTSFVIPDPLTGRTGTEEAFQCLSCGLCQPWAPLTSGPAASIVCLSHLSPRRNYYPSGMKVMAQVYWDPELTMTIQNDGFRDIVEGIYAKSEQLSVFEAQQTLLPALEPAGDRHLMCRSHTRRRIYERSNPGIDSHAADTKYYARDGWRTTGSRDHVFQCTELIHAWPSQMATHPDLAAMLQTWPSIGGYSGSYDKVLLSDLLDTRLSTDWGSLVTLCQSSTKENIHHLMFLFATMSFRPDADMDAIKTLIAFVVIESMRNLVPPKWPLYSHFKQGHVPSLHSLTVMIKPCLIPYGDDERTRLGFGLTPKHRRKLVAAQSRHEMQAEEDTKTLANFLLRQWPCAEPTIEGFSVGVLINIEQALKLISDEWLRLFQNFELSQHVSVVQEVLDSHRSTKKREHPVLEVPEQTVFPIRCRGGEFPTLFQLLKKTGMGDGRPLDHRDDLSRTIVVKHNHHYGSPLDHKNEKLKGPVVVSIPTKCVDPNPPPFREGQELKKIIDTVDRYGDICYIKPLKEISSIVTSGGMKT